MLIHPDLMTQSQNVKKSLALNIPNAKLNYQMLQTLTDVSDQELALLAQKSIDTITRIASDRQTMLDVFGATDRNDNQNDFQKCLSQIGRASCRERV